MTHEEFLRLEGDVRTSSATWSRESALDYFCHLSFSPAWGELHEVKKFSMLAVETLAMCRAWGMAARSGILEIGPYVGGSTVALALGLQATGRNIPMVSIDVGGSYLDQPHLPSSDIHADWARNVEAGGCGGISTLLKGFSVQDDVKAEARRIIGQDKFDVFFLDADGDVDRAIADYGDVIADDCLMIIDDYYNVIGTQEKISVTSAQINARLAEGSLEQYVLAPFSTWFGRLNKRQVRPKSFRARWFASRG